MSHNIAAPLCVIALFLLFGTFTAKGQTKPKNPDEAKFTEERDRLKGTWAVIGCEEDGKVHMYVTTNSYWKFGEWDAYEWYADSEFSILYPLWRSDPTSKPRKLDLVSVHEISHELLIRQGVYEIDGDNLAWTIPNGFAGKKTKIDAANHIFLSVRPARLATAPDDGLARLIMKRVKDPAEAMTPEERKAKSQGGNEKK